MKQLKKHGLVLAACMLLAASTATAQKAVDGVKDLVGRGASVAEKELENRGFEFVHTEKSDVDTYSYWIEPGSKDCVSVHTVEGRCAAIVYTKDADCDVEKKKDKEKPKGSKDWPTYYSSEPGEEGFDTVCGVISGGKTHKMKCHLRNESCGGSGQCRTHLTFPDNAMTLTWHSGGEVSVKASGVKAEQSKVSTQNGQTRFDFGGNTYFVYRLKDDGQRELAKLK